MRNFIVFLSLLGMQAQWVGALPGEEEKEEHSSLRSKKGEENNEEELKPEDPLGLKYEEWPETLDIEDQNNITQFFPELDYVERMCCVNLSKLYPMKEIINQSQGVVDLFSVLGIKIKQIQDVIAQDVTFEDKKRPLGSVVMMGVRGEGHLVVEKYLKDMQKCYTVLLGLKKSFGLYDGEVGKKLETILCQGTKGGIEDAREFIQGVIDNVLSVRKTHFSTQWENAKSTGEINQFKIKSEEEMRDWVLELEKAIKKDGFWKAGDVSILRAFQVAKEEYHYTLEHAFFRGIGKKYDGDSQEEEGGTTYKHKAGFVDEIRETIFSAGDFLDSLNQDLKKVQGEEKVFLLRRAANICQRFEAAVKRVEDALKEIVLYPSVLTDRAKGFYTLWVENFPQDNEETKALIQQLRERQAEGTEESEDSSDSDDSDV